METLQRIPMSWEDYLAMPPYPRHEWVDGTAIVMSANPRPDHQQVARRLANLIEASAPDLHVYEAVNVRLTPKRVRVPDVVVLADRATELFVDAVPVVVAEVLSPSTRTEDLVRKAREYLEAGIQQYWVVDPAARELVVRVSDGSAWVESARLVDGGLDRADVAVADHGVVPLVLGDLLDS